MTFQKIASELAKREGRKSQARIGDIREILKELVNLSAEERVSDPPGNEWLGKCPLYALQTMADKRAEKMIKRGRK